MEGTEIQDGDRVTAKKKPNRIQIERPPESPVHAIEGGLNASGFRFAIVVSRFNSFITERLFQSAYDGLVRSGAKRKNISWQ